MNKKFIDSWEWHEFEELESTNDKAVELTETALKGEKFIITATRQTRGRGRRGRSWESLSGNLFSTYVLEVPTQKLGQLIFVVGLSLAETIKSLGAKDIKLKWPNDVLLNGSKVSGILIEKGAGDFFAVGIGINIVSSPKIEGLIYPATSLKEEQIQTDRISFLNLYIKHLNKNLSLWENKGFEPIKQNWLNNAKGLGSKISINQEDGSKEGTFKGVDDNGLLLLENNGKIEKIYAGDVYYK